MANDTLKHVETMIGADAVVYGNLKLKGGVIIYGTIFGDVITDGPARISRKALVKGNVAASDAYIGGAVEGNLTTNGKVVLKSHSKVSGDIVYQKLVIEEGAQFEGRCDLYKEVEAGNQHSIERAGRVDSLSQSVLYRKSEKEIQ